MISRPSHIPSFPIESSSPAPKWDDLKAREDFEFDSSPVVQAGESLSTNAILTIGVGVYEWIYWYLKTHTSRKEPYQVLEASWYGLYKPDAFTYIEFDRKEWMGQVHGPLWCGMMGSTEMIDYRDVRESVAELGLNYLPSLAVHILPDSTPFEDWLDLAISRFESLYLKPEESLFENLFEEMSQETVPREALDLDNNFSKENTQTYIDDYIGNIDVTNPFIEA